MTTTGQIPTATVLRCWAEIDLRNLRTNVATIRRYLGGQREYVAVVKADAYGLGLGAIVRTLLASGVRSFAVANVAEALQVRDLARRARIIVLSPILREEDEYLFEHDLIPMISSPGEHERLQELGRAHGTSIPFHLKIDTGMGRLGVHFEDIASLATLFAPHPHAHIVGICTHFSCADSDPEFTRRQRERFLAILKKYPLPASEVLMIHADNSAGLDSLEPQMCFNAVRIGLLQLGCAPNPASVTGDLPLSPVLSLHTRIGLIKELPAGSGVSYGRTHVTSSRCRIAVLTAGYCDGIPVSASNRAHILVAGTRCPIIGRVTMDQTIIDVSHVDPAAIAVGDIATIVGSQGKESITLHEFSAAAETIPWEICCSISKRVARITNGEATDG